MKSAIPKLPKNYTYLKIFLDDPETSHFSVVRYQFDTVSNFVANEKCFPTVKRGANVVFLRQLFCLIGLYVYKLH